MDIPLNRVLGITEDKSTVDRLLKLRESIDIVRLSDEIEMLSERLSREYEEKLRRLNNA